MAARLLAAWGGCGCRAAALSQGENPATLDSTGEAALPPCTILYASTHHYASTHRETMLERRMEDAIARCPDMFIESDLTLVRRQVVINGRRPDLLFSDSLSRDLLVEIQSGPLDEDHLQRHF